MMSGLGVMIVLLLDSCQQGERGLPVPSASTPTAVTADLAKVGVTQKQRGNLTWQP
jgi:hypothetical protein